MSPEGALYFYAVPGASVLKIHLEDGVPTHHCFHKLTGSSINVV